MDRGQTSLLTAAVEDYVMAEAPVWVIDAFVGEAALSVLAYNIIRAINLIGPAALSTRLA
jgi:hypothetical protein